MLWRCATPPTANPAPGTGPGSSLPTHRVLWFHASPLPCWPRRSAAAGSRATGCSEWRWEDC